MSGFFDHESDLSYQIMLESDVPDEWLREPEGVARTEPNDHILPEGVEVVCRTSLLLEPDWNEHDPDAPDGDAFTPICREESGRVYALGRLERCVSEGSFNAVVAKLRTCPDDPRWRCVEWLTGLREFVFDLLLAEWGHKLGIGGHPIVAIVDNKSEVQLLWRVQNGGYIAHIRSLGGACGGCFGCLSTPVNQEYSLASWVYFVQSSIGGPVKIGRSSNPIARLSALQTAHPHPLRIIAKMAGGIEVERSLHRLFAASRIRPDGEWFNPTPDLVAFIKEIGGV